MTDGNAQLLVMSSTKQSLCLPPPVEKVLLEGKERERENKYRGRLPRKCVAGKCQTEEGERWPKWMNMVHVASVYVCVPAADNHTTWVSGNDEREVRTISVQKLSSS